MPGQGRPRRLRHRHRRNPGQGPVSTPLPRRRRGPGIHHALKISEDHPRSNDSSLYQVSENSQADLAEFVLEKYCVFFVLSYVARFTFSTFYSDEGPDDVEIASPRIRRKMSRNLPGQVVPASTDRDSKANLKIALSKQHEADQQALSSSS